MIGGTDNLFRADGGVGEVDHRLPGEFFGPLGAHVGQVVIPPANDASPPFDRDVSRGFGLAEEPSEAGVAVGLTSVPLGHGDFFAAARAVKGAHF